MPRFRFDAEFNRRTKRKYNKYDMRGKYGKIILDNGMRCIFDKEDLEIVKSCYWSYNPNNRRVNGLANGQTMQIARFIMIENGYNLSPLDFVDHKNRDVLDNRKENLRICTRSENAINKGCQANNTSGHPGVSYHIKQKKYQAYIKVNQKHIHLGSFENIEDAILAREAAEEKYFGDFLKR